MNRRDFLVRSGAVLSASTLAAAGRAYAARRAERPLPTDWGTVRDQFNTDKSYAHLAGFFLASHPKPVRDAIAGYRDELDRNPIHTIHDRLTERDAAVATAAADYLGVVSTDIALTDSTTMGLGLVYTGLDLGPGDEILTSKHDHYSTVTALQFGQQRMGATVVQAPLYQNSHEASVDEILASLAAHLTPNTKIVALTWVHSKTGLRLPVREIADLLDTHYGAGNRPLLCIDGVHGMGAVPGDPADMGCDIFIAGTHKWMFGPRGTGIVWASGDAWPRIAPTIPPFSNFFAPGPRNSPGGFHSFEHRWAVDEAFLWHERIGKHRIYDRVAELNTWIREELAGMAHVTVHTPKESDLASGIVCFEVDGRTPAQVVRTVERDRVLASVSPYQPPYARLSAGLLNDEADVERAISAVGGL